MKQVDVLFTNAHILTMDQEFTQYTKGALAVNGETIAAVGAEAQIRQEYTGKETIDCGGRVLMPGLINAHTHVPMTLLRGLADDLRLDVWLMGYMMPVEREFVTPEFVSLGTKIACAEMIRSGTTCFADMYYFEDEVAKATADAGLRAVCGESVLKFPAPDAPSYDDALNYTRTFVQKWKGHPLIVPAIAPHAPYTTTPELLKACAAIAMEFDIPLHTHLSETSQEVDGLRAQYGMPGIPYFRKQNLLDTKAIAAHCVYIDEGEMREMAKHRVGAIHNPSSNMKLASGAAPTKRMLELGVSVGLGTDGPASNNDLDMFEEMRLASFLAKLSTLDPTALPARSVVLMATRLGARALHIDSITGSLIPGKRADMILVDIHPLHNQPRFNRDETCIYSQIVYATKSTDVTDSMVNGKWLMRDRKVLTLDEKALIAEAAGFAARIDAFLAKREQSVLSKLVAIGGAMEEESFEVQVKVKVDETAPIVAALEKGEIEIERKRHYRQFDTYFDFEDSTQGRIRYREDEFVDEKGQVSQVRARLTLLGQDRENKYPSAVLLSRSRYLAPANNSLRFYREYFQPKDETEIQKDRLRYLVHFKDTEFFINVDTMKKPAIGNFLEVKSRTWSRQDAESKAKIIAELLDVLGVKDRPTVTTDYIDLALKK
ncbi:MAG TPA: amidohydrolase family protein [Candidatus Ozemobacteraceae bacterium]|nr:amidohydrolase family protein [Candidatus Ozemobacteraceae bacterium]